jgi:hypothetical protein
VFEDRGTSDSWGSELLLKRLVLDLCMIKFGCDIKMLKTSPNGESWMLRYSEFSFEVFEGHVG